MKRARGSFHARRVNGYHSKDEAERSAELHIWEKIGAIRNLQEQVRFVLIPRQDGIDGDGNVFREHPCTYIADFVYEWTDTGRMVVEDVKGIATPDYIMKRKMMLFLKGIRISEVCKK
jgi:hypothetical protein